MQRSRDGANISFARHANHDCDKQWKWRFAYKNYLINSLNDLRDRYVGQFKANLFTSINEEGMADGVIQLVTGMIINASSNDEFQIQWDHLHALSPAVRKMMSWTKSLEHGTKVRVRFEPKSRQSPVIGVLDYSLFYDFDIWKK